MAFYVLLQSYCMCPDTWRLINIKPFLCKQHPDIILQLQCQSNQILKFVFILQCIEPKSQFGPIRVRAEFTCWVFDDAGVCLF